MAQMRRALEACEDGRTRALPSGVVDESRELAVSLLVGMANAERDRPTDGEYAVAPVPAGYGSVSAKRRNVAFSPLPLWHQFPATIGIRNGKR